MSEIVPAFRRYRCKRPCGAVIAFKNRQKLLVKREPALLETIAPRVLDECRWPVGSEFFCTGMKCRKCGGAPGRLTDPSSLESGFGHGGEVQKSPVKGPFPKEMS
jgi:hypothetical protein